MATIGNLCDTCGANYCLPSNKFGVCQQTPDCLREYKRRWQNPNWRERRGKDLKPGPGVGATFENLTCTGEPRSVRRGDHGMIRMLPVRCHCGNEYLLRLDRWGEITMCKYCGARQEKNQVFDRQIPPGVYAVYFPDAEVLKIGYTNGHRGKGRSTVCITEGALKNKLGVKFRGILIRSWARCDTATEAMIQAMLVSVLIPVESHTRVPEWFTTIGVSQDRIEALLDKAFSLANDAKREIKYELHPVVNVKGL